MQIVTGLMPMPTSVLSR